MNDYKLKIGELRSYMESLLQVSGNLAPRKVGRRKNFNLREVFMRSFQGYIYITLSPPGGGEKNEKTCLGKKIKKGKKEKGEKRRKKREKKRKKRKKGENGEKKGKMGEKRKKR